MRKREVVGEKFGRLTVLEDRDDTKHKEERKRRTLLCQCECGNIIEVNKYKVTSGYTRSCGCLFQETIDKWAESRKTPTNTSCINEIYGVYKKGAEIRGYEFNVSKEHFVDVITQPCIYCGRQYTSERRRKRKNETISFKYTGIDRYDNTKGYVEGNLVPCCKECNRMKTDHSVSHFLELLERVFARKEQWLNPVLQ